MKLINQAFAANHNRKPSNSWKHTKSLLFGFWCLVFGAYFYLAKPALKGQMTHLQGSFCSIYIVMDDTFFYTKPKLIHLSNYLNI